MKKLPKLVVILGPTASGKTGLSVELAKKFNGEIISADSRQFYRGMNIGTAKTTKKEMQGIKHYLLDFLKPNQTFNLAEFQTEVKRLIKLITKKGKLPFLVGGTGLYISAVIENYNLPEESVDLKLRQKLNRKTLKQLQSDLKRLKPDIKIDWNNRHRLIRAIEMARTQKEFVPSKGKKLYNNILITPKISREALYTKIDQRIGAMIKQGLVKEVKQLAQKYSWDLPAMSGIGYRQFKDYLAGKSSLDEAIARVKSDTHHYAKRQLTWFKRYKNKIHPVKNITQAKLLIKKWLK